MRTKDFYYRLNSQDVELGLCQMECRALFGEVAQEKGILSSKVYDPSISPFLRARMEITHHGKTAQELLHSLERSPVNLQGFKIDYLKPPSKPLDFKQRVELMHQLGQRIHGIPDLKNPKAILGLSWHQGRWIFGPMVRTKSDWQNHNQKPKPYSNSFPQNLAKALVNIASQGEKKLRLVDPCCGAGTVLLEAFYGGYSIKGWDINKKVTHDARENLIHFGFPPMVKHGDISEIEERFDAAIVDLPYGLFSVVPDDTQDKIIRSAKSLAPRLVLVSIGDIRKKLDSAGLVVLDHCRMAKRRRAAMIREVWVCGKNQGLGSRA